MPAAGASTMPRSRDWRGPAVLSYGFRPFFLLAGVEAALVMVLWVLWYRGAIDIPSAFPPLAWHAHELLFGYVWAVVAGFLLTAVPNWTGRLPVVGWPLAGLVGLWLLGRIAVALSAQIGFAVTAITTLVFPTVLIGALAREIIAGRNLRNLRVLGVVAVLMAGQIVFLVEAAGGAAAVYGPRIAIAAIIMLIILIGGRIVPSFTANWLRRENPGREPVPFGRFDVAASLVAAVALAGWAALPAMPEAGGWLAAILAAAGLAHMARLARWAGDRTLREPLVTVLHVAYAFIPLGFLIAALGAWSVDYVGDVAAMHAWTAGAIGLMTLAVMTRATRGHTGRQLTAPPGTVAIYMLVAVAALSRIAAAFLADVAVLLMTVAGAAWTAGFALFVILYAPLLTGPRRTG
ncbi:uncharacterized protein involved in response to NO [Tepidamorphus gemmatus]|uniref:Uncharacterized protein involved in response to NO n=1 Tax=Tepidamorphus gemmatus TaxID=747076 RepID=A0A4R3LVI5_9HYPH|nr:NnrS family protein [Tepidamorphus gemmatus]TCT03689.1 uncharacterized protein involved in response to NO [Tepidamorphus gemmatus]